MSTSVQLCCFRVGDEEYAVDIRRVEEVLPAPQVTPVPRAPAFLEGVVRVRGEVLPVVDVRRRLGVEPRVAPRRRARMVVCRVGRRRLGLLVDAITQVTRVERAELKPAPLASAPGRASHVLGVAGTGDHFKLLLDVKALLEEDPA